MGKMGENRGNRWEMGKKLKIWENGKQGKNGEKELCSLGTLENMGEWGTRELSIGLQDTQAQVLQENRKILGNQRKKKKKKKEERKR